MTVQTIAALILFPEIIATLFFKKKNFAKIIRKSFGTERDKEVQLYCRYIEPIKRKKFDPRVLNMYIPLMTTCITYHIQNNEITSLNHGYTTIL